MAYSNLTKFYQRGQYELMVYLNRRGMSCREIANLKWSDLDGNYFRRKPKKPIKLTRELKVKIFRLKLDTRHTTVPLSLVFYAGPPTGVTSGAGRQFSTNEIWRICGEPHEKLLTKAVRFATMRIAKVLVTNVELEAGTVGRPLC